MDTFPVENTPLPTKQIPDPADATKTITHTYDGWLLFLDEFNSASLSVQKATYKLTLDRMVGQHHLNKRVVIVCAGNLETDNAITSKLSTAMQSRLVHLELSKDNHKEWIQWAQSNNVDYRITSFINYKPEMLNAFKPDHTDYTFPCQRTWDFVSRLISGNNNLGNDMVALLSGTIGEGAAREFIGFTKVFHDLPSIADIVANPNSAKLPASNDSVYAVTGLLSNYAAIGNIKQIIAYASRLPTEFTVLTFQGALRRNPTLLQNEHMEKWLNDNIDVMG
jgi:hypothetical protein